MRDLIQICLLGVLAGVLVKVHSQTNLIEGQSAKISELKDQIASANTAPASLELQARCAKGAEEAFRRDDWDKKDSSSFESHYNSKLGRCFLRENTSSFEPGLISVHHYVVDAFENKTVGQYHWINSGGKKYWEVKPSECDVTMPSGEEKTCESSEDFDELSKAYME